MLKKEKADNVRTVPKLDKITNDLHEILKRETGDVVEIGRLLTSAKEEVGHGKFLPWLEREFSLSEKTANRYMAAHKFMKEVAGPLLKSDNLADLRLRPSAVYELVKIQTYGGIADDDGNLHKITRADLEAVLREAAENWIGEKRLIEIFRSRHPETTEADGEIKPEDAGETLRKTTTGEAVPDTEVAGEVADDEAEQTSETPPHPVPKPKSALSAKDEGNLSTFNTIIKNLTRLASGSAEKYAAATVQTADLETAADFVRAVADLKKKRSAGSSTSADKSAADRKQYYAKDKAA